MGERMRIKIFPNGRIANGKKRKFFMGMIVSRVGLRSGLLNRLRYAYSGVFFIGSLCVIVSRRG